MTEKDKQTEEKIFEAATAVFIEKGMAGTRMQEIADRAGINKSLLHYYFRTKERLFTAVYEVIVRQLFQKIAPMFEKKLTLENKIRLFVSEHMSFLQQNPRLVPFFLNEINRNPKIVKSFIEKLEIDKFWDSLNLLHKEELVRYSITRENIPQLITSIFALSGFPFMAKELIVCVFEKTGYDFDNYIEQRKEYVADFVINAIKNNTIG
ncbi:MAG: TetR/AcrR family transcriptional regulator [Bacteroidales bacterium]|nr:TetR/AcrR family transcriptional regulator [Bacteroidales bacterium]MDD3891189.1 TetR/AcrR family transcriptional regulator [Bacteroidales bacterium]MDY0199831.1 TetR/AcrR family transcriptional regulator [Tenuifilaceae bacterium]